MTTWEETTTLFQAWGGSGYDWSVVEIISRPHGDTVQYAVYEDAGCSCRGSKEDPLDSYDLTWTFDFMDARREVERSIREDEHDFNDAEKAELYAELRSIKP